MKIVAQMIELRTACGCTRLISVDRQPYYYWTVPLAPVPLGLGIQYGEEVSGSISAEVLHDLEKDRRVFEYRETDDVSGVRIYRFVERRTR